ncbi:hypothetical protein ACFX1W_037987 [Malus domestica]
MEEAHSGVCGVHQSGPKLHFQLKRMGYYWPSMVKDCLEHAKRYGVPRYIITDNGKQFSNRLVDELCEKYKFKQHKSSMYHAPVNGLVEAFNKTLCNLLKKVIGRTKRDWHERISEAL